VGKYAATVGNSAASHCLDCPPNADTEGLTGSDDPSDCLCDAGYSGTIVVGNDVCTACSVDQYKEDTGTAPCTACAPNSHVSLPAALTQVRRSVAHKCCHRRRRVHPRRPCLVSACATPDTQAPSLVQAAPALSALPHSTRAYPAPLAVSLAAAAR